MKKNWKAFIIPALGILSGAALGMWLIYSVPSGWVTFDQLDDGMNLSMILGAGFGFICCILTEFTRREHGSASMVVFFAGMISGTIVTAGINSPHGMLLGIGIMIGAGCGWMVTYALIQASKFIWKRRRKMKSGMSGILMGVTSGLFAGMAVVIAAEHHSIQALWGLGGMLVGLIVGASLFWSDHVYDGREEGARQFLGLFTGLGIGWALPLFYLMPNVSMEALWITSGMFIGFGPLSYITIMAGAWWKKYRRTDITLLLC